MPSAPQTISILLASYNGSAFLREQLASIHAQSHKDWSLILSDDGSCDDTLAIARACISKERLDIFQGPQRGIALNFWNALMKVPDGNYAAFCDQDDVWHPNKLERAFMALHGNACPALYSSGRYVTDAQLNVLGEQSRSLVKSFARSLFRNQVAGHTCVLSPQAVQMLKRFPPAPNVPFHDWWAMLVLSALGARFIHDPYPSLYYRQHEANVLGAMGGRVKLIRDGTYRKWLSANHAALWHYRQHFPLRIKATLGICLPFRARLSKEQHKQMARL
ncbi:glycosyltransferase [Planktotalea sp.]|uniref:glycosyltransferase n=1 Tax=Planktotalea sp. TaxID=2029877 RepID=UPI003D6C5C96